MLEDNKEIFPGIDNAWVGQYRPYISTEVDCESLFNQYGYISQPKQANKKIRTFEQLVIPKQRLQYIFYKHNTNNEWDDTGERDDKKFLQVDKDI